MEATSCRRADERRGVALDWCARGFLNMIKGIEVGLVHHNDFTGQFKAEILSSVPPWGKLGLCGRGGGEVGSSVQWVVGHFSNEWWVSMMAYRRYVLYRCILRIHYLLRFNHKKKPKAEIPTGANTIRPATMKMIR